MIKRSATFTSHPNTLAPPLLCPVCDRLLVYRQTAILGIRPIERCDYLECRNCGPFEYSERTRELRPTTDMPFKITSRI